jgi:hypothetical protein
VSIHSHIRQNFQTVPFQGRGLTGICFEPFQSLPLDEIPWDTLADEPNPTYRLEKSSRTRCVVSFEWDASRLGAGAPPTLRLYAKRVLSKSLRRAFTSLVHQSKARKELELGLKMFDAGIATALPVVYAERRRLGFLRECFLATVGLEPSQPFYISFLNLESAEARLKALAELALFIRKGHEGGFYHDDCSTEHVFVEGPPTLRPPTRK